MTSAGVALPDRWRNAAAQDPTRQSHTKPGNTGRRQRLECVHTSEYDCHTNHGQATSRAPRTPRPRPRGLAGALDGNSVGSSPVRRRRSVRWRVTPAWCSGGTAAPCETALSSHPRSPAHHPGACREGGFSVLGLQSILHPVGHADTDQLRGLARPSLVPAPNQRRRPEPAPLLPRHPCPEARSARAWHASAARRPGAGGGARTVCQPQRTAAATLPPARSPRQ